MRRRISGSKLHEDVIRIAAFGDRKSGSAVERQVMQYIGDRFVESGLKDVTIEWFEMHRWSPKVVRLGLLPEGRDLRCQPIWYCGSTTCDGLKAECVSCGYGMPHEFSAAQGKIAVIDSRILLHFWPTYRFFNSYQAAVAAGALALVVVIDAPGDLIPIFTAEEEKHDNPIPAVLVSRSDGAALKERIQAGKTELLVNVAAESSIASTGDVVGIVPGESDEFIIAGAHHDSIYRGAVDNAGGLAALLALADKFANRREPPRKSIIFATHPGHELLIGAREFIKRRQHLLDKTAVYITIDGAGSDNYEEIDGKIVKTGRDESRGAFISPNHVLAEIVMPVIKKYRLQPAALMPADLMCPNEDLEGRFLEAGVPIIDIIGKPIWYHTEDDTPDKCTPDQLERYTLAHLELIEKLDALPAAEIRAAGREGLDPAKLINALPSASQPTIDFTWLPQRPRAGEPTLIYVGNFDDREGILVDMEWSIGEDTGSRGPALLHVFDKPGEYCVRLKVRNDLGAEGPCEKSIRVT
ncbi:MAG: M28 family peptidase [Candidatus Abyssobacteria bacterium SURF_17]|uniref:M28 family peptidase n=1 Tax=Candidatus Abyssobacteria bacterium SURF_17 TaxID=2093361 RepID=A0A419ET79_9BACT|nr:MAG: M28 family peptidase [Candidatus Abyssubacteria bacterium SURF_17]